MLHSIPTNKYVVVNIICFSCIHVEISLLSQGIMAYHYSSYFSPVYIPLLSLLICPSIPAMRYSPLMARNYIIGYPISIYLYICVCVRTFSHEHIFIYTCIFIYISPYFGFPYACFLSHLLIYKYHDMYPIICPLYTPLYIPFVFPSAPSVEYSRSIIL